jgi:hypothetical protein
MAEKLLLKIKDVLELLNMSRRTLQNLRLRGQFPPATRQLGRTPMWHRNVILGYAAGEWRPATPSRRRAAAAKG